MELKPVRHIAFVKMIIVFYLEPILPCRLADVLSLPGRVLLKKISFATYRLISGVRPFYFFENCTCRQRFHVLVQDLDLL